MKSNKDQLSFTNEVLLADTIAELLELNCGRWQDLRTLINYGCKSFENVNVPESC